GHGRRNNVDIEYATQTVQDGTGRVVNLARSFVGDSPFILSYGDILINPVNYKRVVDLPDECEGIITVTRGEDASKGGAVFVNEQMELVDLREKPKPGEPTSPWYNGGLCALRPGMFDFIAKLTPSPRGEYELTDAIRDLAQSGRKVKALELTGEWAAGRHPEILATRNQRGREPLACVRRDRKRDACATSSRPASSTPQPVSQNADPRATDPSTGATAISHRRPHHWEFVRLLPIV